MPFSRWIIAFGLGGAFLIGTVVLGIIRFDAYQAEHVIERENAAKDQAQNTNERVPNCASVMARDGTLAWLDWITHEIASATESAYSKYDLKAQQDMAEWAFAMFLANALMVGITLATLVIISATLIQAKRAASFTGEMIKPTRQAADGATRAANAAISSNESMKRFGQLETRAYLAISGVTINDIDENFFSINFTVENTGSSPAFEVQAIYATFSDSSIRKSFRLPNIDAVRHFPVAASLLPKGKQRSYIPVSRAKKRGYGFSA